MRKAFTLIELLVVIAIIAILAAILFPVFARAKSAAKTAVCLGNMKQLGTAFAMYLGDFDGVYPPPYCNRFPCSAWVLSGEAPYSGADNPLCDVHHATSLDLCSIADPKKGSLWPYAKSAAIYRCPVDQIGTYRYASLPRPLDSSKQKVTYAMNQNFAPACVNYYDAGCIYLPNGGYGQPSLPESAVPFPSATFMLVDEDVRTRNDGQFVPLQSATQFYADTFGTQHVEGANLLNADTSAKRYAKAAVVSPALYRRFIVQRDQE